MPKRNQKSFIKNLLTKLQGNQHIVIATTALTIFGFIAGSFFVEQHQVKTVTTKHPSSFKGGRSIVSRRSIYLKKERILEQKLRQLNAANENLRNEIAEIKTILKEPRDENIQPETEEIPEQESKAEESIPAQPHLSELKSTIMAQRTPRQGGQRRFHPKNPSVISFPVKQSKRPGRDSIQLPAGAYVKAKLLTGVEAPEGKALPILLQADYAFIGPNKTRVDLSGCFLIAKSTGNLSIERVEMQATKMSCVAKSGKMFEKDINGFVADDKDNSFAVMGVVNSKQDRVAAMAFLSGIVEGIGRSIQTAQTATSKGPDGQTSSNVVGDQSRYILAGGASNAASMVTQWYLKQAQSLLPTINVGSGRDVWLVMQDTVSLPNWYFRKVHRQAGSNVYSYLSKFTN